MTNYPSSWIEAHFRLCWFDADPIVAIARRQCTAFAWTNSVYEGPMARAYGLQRGYSQPIYGQLGLEGVFTIASSERGATEPTQLNALMSFGQVAYETARNAKRRFAKDLSLRERQVVRLAARGANYPQMGAILNISPNTARGIVRNAMVKLKARSRGELVLRAVEAGWINVFDTYPLQQRLQEKAH